ncbi:MAG: 3-hydroxyacyl-ACP dehydratase FabZ [Alphaproteobacteria bacterium]|nr:3-hydroxyacyl-ACP dehydratase FabZ [Alphaproteobacteria bacterium]
MTEAAAPAPKKSIDVLRIMQLLPHRYPFLLVDKIIEMDGEQSCIGIKNVTINEPFFPGHFPSRPVMPGVLIVEAMAQTAGAMVLEHHSEHAGKLVFFTSIDGCKFRRPVGPGDTLHFHVELAAKRPPIYKFKVQAKVDGKLAAEAEIGASLIDNK